MSIKHFLHLFEKRDDMKSEKLKSLFDDFIEDYDEKSNDSIWSRQSEQFKRFWKEKMLSHHIQELNDQEVDEIVRLLDVHAKGNTKSS